MQDILQLLEKKGVTGGMVAQQLNIKPTVVYNTIKCNGSGSRRVRVKIAHCLGCLPSMLWCDLPPKIKLQDDYDYLHDVDVTVSRKSSITVTKSAHY
jgi:hypothetical protein